MRATVLKILLLFVVTEGPAFAQLIEKDVSVGFLFTTHKLDGDTRNGAFKIGTTPLSVRYNLMPSVFLEAEIGYAQLQARLANGKLRSNLLTIGTKAGIRFLPDLRFNPLSYLTAGIFNFDTGGGKRFWDGYLGLGLGLEYFVSRRVGLNFFADYRLTTGDDFDASRAGWRRDGFASVGTGLHYHLAGRKSYGRDARNQWIPGAGVPVRQVGAKAGRGKVTEQFHRGSSQEEFKNLLFEKNELRYAIQKKEREVRLLRLKIEQVGPNVAAHSATEHDAEKDGTPMAGPITTLFRSALALYQVGYYDTAIASFTTLLETAPNHVLIPNWWYWLGESYFGRGDVALAARSFEHAASLSLDSGRSELIQLMLGICYARLEDYKKATSHFEQILATSGATSLKQIAAEYLAEAAPN